MPYIVVQQIDIGGYQEIQEVLIDEFKGWGEDKLGWLLPV